MIELLKRKLSLPLNDLETFFQGIPKELFVEISELFGNLLVESRYDLE
jgi:hypothetical protein